MTMAPAYSAWDWVVLASIALFSVSVLTLLVAKCCYSNSESHQVLAFAQVNCLLGWAGAKVDHGEGDEKG